jgi:hypothetical protein
MSYNLINRDPIAKVGMRIRMGEMDGGELNPVDENLEGTIHHIDDIGTLHVKWDDGRYIGVIPNVDTYQLLPAEDEQIGFDVFEAEDKPILNNSKATPAGKNLSKKFKAPMKKLGVKSESEEKNLSKEVDCEMCDHSWDIEPKEKHPYLCHDCGYDSQKKKYNYKELEKFRKNHKKEEELEETMTAGGGNGLTGAPGYSYSPSLGYKNESKTIKVKDLMKEETTTSAISATVDFVVANLLGWGTKEDMSPPWPSPKRKADNNEIEDWWWQKIPTYNGGVITDPYAKTNETWDDDELEVNIDDDMTQFQKDIYKNPKKYKQSVITIDKGFDLNVSPPNNDWKTSLQKGVTLKNQKSEEPAEHFRNRHYSRTIKKEEVSNFVDDLISESKKKEEEKEDLEETTTFGSVFGGGFPVGPAFAAKKGKWTPSKKPIWKGGKIIQRLNNTGILGENTLFTEINKIKFVPKGGKFVKIKDKCAKYNNQPWCSQGAIDKPLELSNNTFESIKKVSKKTGLPFNVILENINKKLFEDFGRNYTIQSLYDVIQDELLNDPKIEKWKMVMDSPIGGVENFEMPHHKSDYGSTEGITDDDGTMGVKGPHGILAMVILPKLVEMGILTGNLKDENEMGILNTISELLYHDIKPEGFNDVKHDDDDLQLSEETIKKVSKLSKKLGVSENTILDKIKSKFKGNK